MQTQAQTWQNTCHYREAYAQQLYALPRIEALIQRATHLGLTKILISQEKPMTLSGTQAATNLITHLETLDYQTWWHQRTVSLNTEGIAGTIVTYSLLEIGWQVIKSP